MTVMKEIYWIVNDLYRDRNTVKFGLRDLQ
jgi:hypothetical protein